MAFAEDLAPADQARTRALREPAPQPTEAERFARLRLARSENVGPRTYGYLMRRFRNAEAALAALPTLAARGGKAEYGVCSEATAAAELEAGMRHGAQLLILGDADYPERLAQIDPPPPLLWVHGNVELLSRPAIAIVGARNASALGMRTARRLARELGASGRVVVSGLARGIDSAAHDASLTNGTVAVLAGGVDQIYPPENAALAGRIAAEGAIVSECPMGLEPMARHFPKRNRIISGLADGVVLVEAAARSGSLITARFALEQGREAMACPGAPEDPRAAGCNALIREGAALVRHAGDVTEALAAPRALGMAEEGREFYFDADSFDEDGTRDDLDALADFDEEGSHAADALAAQVIELLGPAPVEVDEIARLCGVTSSELSLAILELDLAGRIDIRPGGLIALAAED